MKKLSAFIERTITDYLENNLDIDMDDIESPEDIIESIDPRYLAQAISDAMENRTIQFSATPQIGTGSAMSCDSCYRPYGIWKSASGIDLNENNISTHGKRIILVDDF